MASETEDEAVRKFKNDQRSPGGTLRQKNTWLNLIRASISKTSFKKTVLEITDRVTLWGHHGHHHRGHHGHHGQPHL